MMRVGIVGLGFIGKMHLAALRKTGIAEVVAVADKVPDNIGKGCAKTGNIAVDANLLKLEDLVTYAEGDELLANPNVDVALIALPTYLHKEFILKAFAAGKHVICEKPLALNTSEGEAIVEAADHSDRLLFVGHCIRFWPAYAAAREIVERETHGKVLRAHFARVSPKPTWGWQDWLMDDRKSGGALLDLHIHDVDYVNSVFGMPESLHANGVRCRQEGVGDVMAAYTYKDGKLITIEGGWNQHAAYPFRMAFRIVCERATLEFSTQADERLHVYLDGGGEETPDISLDDGYACEHRYFFECLAEGRQPTLVTARTSLEALSLVEKENACIA